MNKNLLIAGSLVVIVVTIVVCTIIITDNQKKIIESQQAILNNQGNQKSQNVNLEENTDHLWGNRTIIGFSSHKTVKELDNA